MLGDYSCAASGSSEPPPWRMWGKPSPRRGTHSIREPKMHLTKVNGSSSQAPVKEERIHSARGRWWWALNQRFVLKELRMHPRHPDNSRWHCSRLKYTPHPLFWEYRNNKFPFSISSKHSAWFSVTTPRCTHRKLHVGTAVNNALLLHWIILLTWKNL